MLNHELLYGSNFEQNVWILIFAVILFFTICKYIKMIKITFKCIFWVYFVWTLYKPTTSQFVELPYGQGNNNCLEHYR